jgi:hypothetical protein
MAETSHDIAGAYYQANGVDYASVLECSCGFQAIELDWQDAGAVYDEHLRTAAA